MTEDKREEVAADESEARRTEEDDPAAGIETQSEWKALLLALLRKDAA